jgi:hypothetical protein
MRTVNWVSSQARINVESTQAAATEEPGTSPQADGMSRRQHAVSTQPVEALEPFGKFSNRTDARQT